MQAEPYDFGFDRKNLIYTFFSIGKRGIIPKVVAFELTAPNHFNLAFGDFDIQTQTFDDKVVSNNGDTVKVLTTVIQIIIDFFNNNPFAVLDIQGSTSTRTRLYQKIIKDNLEEIETNFRVLAFLEESEKPELPNFSKNYLSFQITKK